MMKFIDYLRGMVSRGAEHLIASFRYSLDGFGACFRDETAFRQEVAVGAVHFVLSFALQLSLTVFVYLTVLYVLLLAVELINTAVEAAVDCAVNDRHPLAKKAKDCASAAVFCVIAIFAVSWIVVLAKMFGRA